MSYLARLALRALGRPVHARLVPRVDSPPQFFADGESADATGSALPSAPALPMDAERGAWHASVAAIDAASVASRARAAGQHSDGAPMKQTPEQDGRARGSHQPAADAIKAGASALVGGAHRAAAHSATPADRPLSPPPMRFDLGTLNAAQATSSARSLHATPRTAAPSARHLGAQPAWGTPLSETPEQNARESSAAPTLAAAVSRDPAGNDARAASARQAETLRDATARAEPAPVNVEIGRIEVRIAPPPAPASRPRAAPEGFERYWRLRNYLDRSG